MQTLKGGMVRARTSLAAVGPGTFATVQEPFLVWLAPHQAPHSPTWGIQQRDWESPGNLTLKVRGLDYRASTGLGKTETPGGHQHTLCTQHPEQRSSGPTRDWADLPVRVWGSPADVWVHSGPPWGRSSDNSSLGRCSVLASVLLEEVPLGTTIEPPGGRSTNGRSYQVGEGQWQNKNCQTNKN